MKQLCGNSDQGSCDNGLVLLGIMLSTFAPSEDLELFLEMFLSDRKVTNINSTRKNNTKQINFNGWFFFSLLNFDSRAIEVCNDDPLDFLSLMNLSDILAALFSHSSSFIFWCC